MSNMSNSVPYLLAVRTVAAGHRMIAEGWKMFKEAVEAAGTGDLPQLLRSLRGMTMLTPPPPPTPTPPPAAAGPLKQQGATAVPMEVAGVSGVSPVKKEGASSEAVVVVVWEVRKCACPQCSTVRGLKNGCDAHIRQAHTGKVLLWGLCGFSMYNLDSLSRHEKEHN